MENAYVRCLDGAEQFDMVMKYINPTLGIDREFNFKRQLTEPVDTFLNRISVNIEKVINKNLKKKKFKDLAIDNKNNIKFTLDLVNEQNELINRSLTCKEVFTNNPNLRILIDNNLINVKINVPWIEKITLSHTLLCGFPTYPTKFEAYFVDKSKCIFNWYRKQNDDWIKVGDRFFYIPTAYDVGHKLKLEVEPRNDTNIGPSVECESTVEVKYGPTLCPFETRHQFTNNKLSENKFRVVTYNILADLYCDSDYTRETLYPYCPPEALDIDYRKQLILKELIGYKADLICLQEVDEKVFTYDLIPVLSELGYSGIFHKKGGTVTEGLCCLYDSNRFKNISSEVIIFGEQINKNDIFIEYWRKIRTNAKLMDRVLPRTTALQVNVFESADCNNEILVVGNTHLYFHPDADHIRLFQAGLAMTYLQHSIEQLKLKHKDKRITLMFCGDFNSVPECGIYKLMTTGSVSEDEPDWSSNMEEQIKDLSLRQPFKMASACGTPKFTNYTTDFADCLDYIFYQCDQVSVIQYVPLPLLQELTYHTALPSIVFPSDHIALIADFQWQ
ncbi:2',5'-phosphodiesterase 12 isoform X2 [Chrysoperla carnea]|nr:2',5'-phosphodiesterase 12 isoform X2 [Chrysoperla carnea]